MLLDILATQTKEYTKLMLNGTKEEFDVCRLKITHIQEELQSRKQSENDNTNISDTNIEFTSET